MIGIASPDDKHSCFRHRDGNYRIHCPLIDSVSPDLQKRANDSSDVDCCCWYRNDRQCCSYFLHHLSGNLCLGRNRAHRDPMAVKYLCSSLYCFGSYLLDRGTDQPYHYRRKTVNRDIYHAVIDTYH